MHQSMTTYTKESMTHYHVVPKAPLGTKAAASVTKAAGKCRNTGSRQSESDIYCLNLG